MKNLLKQASILPKIMVIVFLFSGWAKAPQKNPELGLVPIKESQAYRQFLNRPLGEHSKTLFLIDRFKDLPFEIIYDGRAYKMSAAAKAVRAFLLFNYKKDWTVQQWIARYAYRSMGRNEVILLRLPDGSVYSAGNLLLQELENLEAAMKEITVPEPVSLPGQLNLNVGGASVMTASEPSLNLVPSPSK